MCTSCVHVQNMRTAVYHPPVYIVCMSFFHFLLSVFRQRKKFISFSPFFIQNYNIFWKNLYRLYLFYFIQTDLNKRHGLNTSTMGVCGRRFLFLFNIYFILIKRTDGESSYFYRSGTVNSSTVNSKFHLIRSYCEYLARILSFHV